MECYSGHASVIKDALWGKFKAMCGSVFFQAIPDEAALNTAPVDRTV